MKELQQIVQEKTNEMIATGALEEMIGKHLAATINDVVKECLRSYGDFGKAIRTKVDAAMNAALGQIALPTYNDFIARQVEQAFSQALNENALAQLQELMQGILITAPKEMTWQDVEEKIREEWLENAQESGRAYISVQAEECHGLHITLEHPSYKQESLRVTLYNSGEKTPNHYHIGYISQDKRRISGTPDGITHAFGLASYFLNLYAMRTSIEIREVEDIYVDND